MSVITSLIDVCRTRDDYCSYFKAAFPSYHIRTFLTARSYAHDIEVVFSQPNFEFVALIPCYCEDPIVYFKDHYPEFFI